MANLTPQQEQAATNRGGNLLVSAAAGSGKTKVLVERLMLYLTDSENPANIDDFLIITYTRAAAAELRSKIADELNERIAANPTNKRLREQLQRVYLAKISTIHSFCSDLLKQYAYRLDIPGDFRIAEQDEAEILRLQVLNSVLENAYSTENLDPDFQAFVDSQEMGRDDENLAKIILELYDNAVCHKEPMTWLNKCLADLNVTGLTDAAETIWGQYMFNELKEHLSLQINAMNQCIERARTVEASEKQLAMFEDDVAWMKQLMACDTWDAIVTSREHKFDRLTFTKKFGDPTLQEQMKVIRDKLKKSVRSRLARFTQNSRESLDQLAAVLPAARGLIHLVETFIDAFSKKKRQLRILDYADLEHLALDLLAGKSHAGPTVIANEVSKQFREVMVDEFQDSNEVQDAIFQSITCQKHNCFMVGDVKQSIYQFRLADPDIFLAKFNAFPDADEAVPGEGRKVLLSKNFRSSPGVIEAVNHICSHCMSVQVGGISYTNKEKLHAGREVLPSGEPEVSLYGIDVVNDTYQEEADFVAEKILELTDGSHYITGKDGQRPITFEDIAIILRSPGSVGMDFVNALENRGIPVFFSKGSNLLLTEEVASLHSFLKVISNPQSDIPLLAVLTNRVFQFSATELAQIRSGNKKESLYDSLVCSDLPKAKEFVVKLTNLRQFARHHHLSELVLEIFSVCGFDKFFAADKFGAEKLQNLQSFSRLLSTYESVGHRTLDQLLEYLDALSHEGISGNAQTKPAGSVEILSVHMSKGLEYPVVFLSGLSRAFNMRDTSEQVLRHKHLGLGLSHVHPGKRIRFPTIAKKAIALRTISDTLSQEMLVLYVALTRARDRLIMTYASPKLETQISEIVNRMDLCDPLLINTSAKCPGDWVLYAALHRSESGALFKLGGYTEKSSVQTSPWHIEAVEGGTRVGGAVVCEEHAEKLPNGVAETIQRSLSYVYPNLHATSVPSKLTATELKGRGLDNEVAQNTSFSNSKKLGWRRPDDAISSGTAYGNAMHAVMQYIRYSACTDIASITEEINRLVNEQFISPEQGASVEKASILRFFETPIGQKAITADVLREFKFTVLQDANLYYPDVNGDKVMLQGVIDLAILEEDGITIVDFKTDRVTEHTLETTANVYFPQVRAYSQALSSIYDLPVKKSLLYFFRIGRFVEVK